MKIPLSEPTSFNTVALEWEAECQQAYGEAEHGTSAPKGMGSALQRHAGPLIFMD